MITFISYLIKRTMIFVHSPLFLIQFCFQTDSNHTVHGESVLARIPLSHPLPDKNIPLFRGLTGL